MDRVCLFTNGSNFYHACKDGVLPVNADFRKVIIRLTGAESRHVQTEHIIAPIVRDLRQVNVSPLAAWKKLAAVDLWFLLG
jgi:hypothetical protein